MNETRQKIEPILLRTYGRSPFAHALIEHVVTVIDRGRFDHGREHAVQSACWVWFPGGDTAAKAAREIEEALS